MELLVLSVSLLCYLGLTHLRPLLALPVMSPATSMQTELCCSLGKKKKEGGEMHESRGPCGGWVYVIVESPSPQAEKRVTS